MTSHAVYDVIVRNGTLVDGSGCTPVKADVAILGDRIAALGELANCKAAREIDAANWVVAPGFIDVHSHDDAAVIETPEMSAKLTQGVTTVIAGNCGISAAPYNHPGNPPQLLRLIFKSDRCIAATFEEYLDKVRLSAPATNCAFLTGHTTLRLQVMGEDLDRTATDREIIEMRELLSQSLQQGSIGLSSGLFYPQARAASTNEVIEVGKPVGAYQGVYTAHLRDESDGVMESLQEALHIGRTIGAPVIVSHHKCMGRRNFGRSVETLALLQEARRGQRVALDVYPYTAASTVLNADMVRHSLRTVVTWCDPFPEFCGRDLEEVADTLGCTPAQAIPKLQPAGALYFVMDEGDVTRILCAPEAMVGSDGLPADQHPHPRLWGTFPRVLGRYVRERGVLTLPNAVHRMTGLSAYRFGIRSRGRVEVGYFADLCIFDPQCVLDSATFEQPQTPAVGIQSVLVNGKVALDNGSLTASRAGRVLTRNAMADG
jgi:N-acyl-D-amino-acid deacylase